MKNPSYEVVSIKLSNAARILAACSALRAVKGGTK